MLLNSQETWVVQTVGHIRRSKSQFHTQKTKTLNTEKYRTIHSWKSPSLKHKSTHEPLLPTFPFCCTTVITEWKNAREEWKNGFVRKWESMIAIEQQRLIESNLQQAGLIKGRQRGPIDSAPKDPSNWTTRLVMPGYCVHCLCPFTEIK